MHEKETSICFSVSAEIPHSCKLLRGNSAEPPWDRLHSGGISALKLKHMLVSYSIVHTNLTRHFYISYNFLKFVSSGLTLCVIVCQTTVY